MPTPVVHFGVVCDFCFAKSFGQNRLDRQFTQAKLEGHFSNFCLVHHKLDQAWAYNREAPDELVAVIPNVKTRDFTLAYLNGHF